MPLSVLLAGPLGGLATGVRRLAPWQGLTERFELVVDRLRSAYLVRWFGTRIPTEGITVRVAIVNSDQLRARWLAIGADRGRASGPPGPNLLEPLMGMTGSLAGTLASPLNAMLLTPLLWRLVDGIVVRGILVVNWLSFGALFTALLPVGALAVLGLPLLANTADVGALYRLLGALAELADPFAEFWRQVSGPRSAVRNVLLRTVLDLLDGIAAAMIQFVGVAAVAVVRILPMVPDLVLGLAETVLAGWRLVGGLTLAVMGTWIALRLWWASSSSPLGVLRLVTRLFTGLLRRMVDRVGRYATLVFDFLVISARIGRLEVERWLIDARPFVASQTTEHPTIAWLKALVARAAVARDWKARVFPPSPSTPSSPLPAPVRRLLLATGMPASAPRFTPPSPMLEPTPVPGTAALRLRTMLTPNPFALDAADRAALDRWSGPPSAFAAERAALERERRDPAGRVRLMRAADYLQHIEPILASSAGLVVEQHALSFITDIEDHLDRLDRELRPRVHPPTKLLRDPQRLRPVIGRLVVRDPSPVEPPARYDALVAAVRARLDASPFVASPTAVPAGR